jgi:uncharacterized protein YndB with AHSA1/START domain
MSYDLKLERLFDATPDEVFDAFVDPRAHKKWFRADQSDWVVSSDLDLRPGGRWDLSFGPEKDPRPYRAVSIFARIERPHRLVFRMTRMWPDASSFDTDFVVTFEKRGNKTLFTMNEAGFPTAEERDGFLGGWPDFIDALERAVAELQRDKRRSAAA